MNPTDPTDRMRATAATSTLFITMRLPDFLIIGAMKAGTTTLYRDLLTNPAVFMPTDKEPTTLADDQVLQRSNLETYAAYFRRAGADQVCGEASTGYAKIPTFQGVPRRALHVLGSNLKVIYLVREPVARAISHHHHFVRLGKMPARFDQAVTDDDTLVSYGRYAMQIEPWLEAFGSQSVLILRFESFVSDRRGTIERVSRFLGIEPRPQQVQTDRVFNKSEGKPYLSGPWHAVQRSFLYTRVLRPFIPLGARESLRKALLSRDDARLATPSQQTLDHLIERLEGDAETLRGLMGLSEPLWDFDQVRAKHVAR
jgi:hypothetical protein